jgi:glucose/arabinose dehydrogenase
MAISIYLLQFLFSLKYLIQINSTNCLFIVILALFVEIVLLFSTSNSPESGQWFDFKVYADRYVQDIHRQKPHYLSIAALGPDANTNTSKVIHSNENIIRLDNEPVTDSGLPSTWKDANKSCSSSFKCIANFSTGWNDKKSIQISTVNTKSNTFSNIIGVEVPVKPNERYELITHLKHNEWSTQSHVKLQGFNETSKHWYQIEKCPSATNESLDWNEYKCVITIEPNVTKVRPILNAGWSSLAGREAAVWFDSLYMTKFKPLVIDPNLKVDVVYQGLDSPVSMQFLGPDDFLVIENKGTVERITNGKEASQPLLLLDVAYNQGLLGIAVQKKVDRNQTGIANNQTYVFLYYTANEKDSNLTQGKDGVSNRLYRYELINNKLVNPKKLLELPAEYDHNGGPLLIGPDKNSLYVSIGDLENQSYKVIAHKALNNKTGMQPDGSGGILHVRFDGEPVHGGLLGNSYPLNLYYAYGIRECFGMDFDPITGSLWNTENGANWGDEINLVKKGFNGGWNKVQGIWKNVGDNIPSASDITYSPSDLVSFDGKGKYRSPEFTWNHTVAPTALKFLSTDKLGKQYENDMLVADVNNGRIYHFKLDDDRETLSLNGSLIDKVANSDKELDSVIFAKGFGVITDLKVGYDGSLYVVVFTEGKIYRIAPRF